MRKHSFVAKAGLILPLLVLYALRDLFITI